MPVAGKRNKTSSLLTQAHREREREKEMGGKKMKECKEDDR